MIPLTMHVPNTLSGMAGATSKNSLLWAIKQSVFMGQQTRKILAIYSPIHHQGKAIYIYGKKYWVIKIIIIIILTKIALVL